MFIFVVGAANEQAAIYYGDHEVSVGKDFSITCIIPVTEQIHWLKNGEPITRHNLRHGRDDHAYALSETTFDGEYFGGGLASGGVDSTSHLVICWSR